MGALRISRPQIYPVTGAGDVTVGRTRDATRAGMLGLITHQRSTLTIVMDGSGVKGLPAAIALDRMVTCWPWER